MHPTHRKIAISAVIAVAALVLLAGAVTAFVRAGIYNVGADDPHYPATLSLLDQLRRASIGKRARSIAVPADLADPARVRQGAGNYNAMCMGCHLAPGMAGTELSKGLYPAPPNLGRVRVDPAEAFWTIKHGIKASGMPAWGKSMDDAYIWNMAAFLQVLPSLDAAAYQAMVASSEGHAHGGGETGGHHHGGEPMHDMPGKMAVHPDADSSSGQKPAHVDPPGTPPHHHEGDESPQDGHAHAEAQESIPEEAAHPHADHDGAKP